MMLCLSKKISLCLSQGVVASNVPRVVRTGFLLNGKQISFTPKEASIAGLANSTNRSYIRWLCTAPTKSSLDLKIEEQMKQVEVLLKQNKIDSFRDAEYILLNFLELKKTAKMKEDFYVNVWLGLGYSYYHLQNYEKALLYYQKALPLVSVMSPSKATNPLIMGYSNLAQVFACLERYEEATNACRESLRVYEAKYEAVQPSLKNKIFLATMLGNLGGYLSIEGKTDEAISVMERALSILDTSLGKHNQYYRTCVNNFARILKSCGKESRIAELEASWKKDIEKEKEFLQQQSINSFSSAPEEETKQLELQWNEMTVKDLDPPGIFITPVLKQFIDAEFKKIEHAL